MNDDNKCNNYKYNNNLLQKLSVPKCLRSNLWIRIISNAHAVNCNLHHMWKKMLCLKKSYKNELAKNRSCKKRTKISSFRSIFNQNRIRREHNMVIGNLKTIINAKMQWWIVKKEITVNEQKHTPTRPQTKQPSEKRKNKSRVNIN